MKSGKCVGCVATPSGGLCLTWSPDGSSIATISSENILSIVDVRKAKVLKTHKFSQEVCDCLSNRITRRSSIQAILSAMSLAA